MTINYHFPGAEYNRYSKEKSKDPLTFYDMNLSAQDHQNMFTCDYDAELPAYDIMQTAWRERNPHARIKAAHEALTKNPLCATAMILIAEEECDQILDVEKMLRAAYKSAESAYRKGQQMQFQSAKEETMHRRDTNVFIYVKRRLAMCARRLGKTKEAIKLFKDLMKEFPMSNLYTLHENLIEALLESQSYADVQAILAKYDDISLPKSASICYTAALLKARQVADKFSPDIASKSGLNPAEMHAVDAIHRAVEFNPHVPQYLLEMKSLVLPPEHVLKRGDSEAITYSFFHLKHWKQVDGALSLLQCTWEGAFRSLPQPLEKGNLFYPYPSCSETVDRQLLPCKTIHDLSVYPKKELPFFILFTAGLCSFTAMLAICTHLYPELMTDVARYVVQVVSIPVQYVFDRVDKLMSTTVFHHWSTV